MASHRTASSSRSKKTHLLEPGQPAPEFSLPADDGTVVSLDHFRGKRVVLYFYPKDDTPGCTREACSFQESLPLFTDAGVAILGVSRDHVASHQNFREKYGLTFSLLVDADGAVHRAYGAWGEKNMYGKKTEGVIRTTVLIDAQGNVLRVFAPVKVDGHADAVLAALAAG